MDILIGLVLKYHILWPNIGVYGYLEAIFYDFNIGLGPKNYLF